MLALVKSVINFEYVIMSLIEKFVFISPLTSLNIAGIFITRPELTF